MVKTVPELSMVALGTQKSNTSRTFFAVQVRSQLPLPMSNARNKGFHNFNAASSTRNSTRSGASLGRDLKGSRGAPDNCSASACLWLSYGSDHAAYGTFVHIHNELGLRKGYE